VGLCQPRTRKSFDGEWKEDDQTGKSEAGWQSERLADNAHVEMVQSVCVGGRCKEFKLVTARRVKNSGAKSHVFRKIGKFKAPEFQPAQARALPSQPPVVLFPPTAPRTTYSHHSQSFAQSFRRKSRLRSQPLRLQSPNSFTALTAARTSYRGLINNLTASHPTATLNKTV
jgi:hypothetical protein